MPGPDLHVHSTASDGALSPAAVVALAASLGISDIALTDHDSVAGVEAALLAARGTGVNVIPGVELSAGVGERSVHILGFLINCNDPTLLSRLAELRALRVERAHRIVAALRDGGIDISIDDVLAAADGGAVGRAHVAGILVESGHAEDVPGAFQTLLGKGAPYYIAKPVFTPGEVIGWIEAAGGVAVLAHPALSGADDLLPALVKDGIAGIEAFHGAHSAEDRERYVRLAAQYELIVTGGSDFHGSAGGTELGSAHVPAHTVPALYAAVERHHRL